jgi:hypothetical protein
VASPDVLDEGVPGDHDPGVAVLPEPAHRAKPHLQAAMVGLDEHVDDLADLVNCPVHIPPPAGDLHVGLVHEPPIASSVPAGAGSPDKQWREPLHPPVHGDVVGLDPALGEQLQRRGRTARSAGTTGPPA